MNNIDINHIECKFKNLPFQTILSFEYLLKEIEKIANDSNNALQMFALETIKHVNNYSAEEQTKLILEDDMLLKKILTFILNPIHNANELYGIFKPFSKEAIYKSAAIDSLLENENIVYDINLDLHENESVIINSYQAYLIILEKVYGLDIHMDMPFTFKAENKKTHLVKFYNVKIDTRFLQVSHIGNSKKLSSKEIKELFDKRYNLDFWNQKIPLKEFIFKGFVKINYTDNTILHIISQLKTDLIDKNALITIESFSKIRNRIRSLLENEKIEIGIIPLYNFTNVSCDDLFRKSIISFKDIAKTDFEASFYQNAIKSKKVIMIDDFSKLEENKISNAFLQKGIKSYGLVPLMMNQEVVGIIEFASDKAEYINMFKIGRLKDLYPMLALALKRSQEDWNDKIRAIIQKKYTAIHPTVEWKFQEKVTKFLTQNSDDEDSGSGAIIFRNVIPIYGASDIQGSSIIRNKAICEDLTDQLSMISSIFDSEFAIKEIPLVYNYNYKIKKYIQNVKNGLNAGDEHSIIEFLKVEIEPILHIIKSRSLGSNELISKYFNALDPELGIIYKKRKDFEDSLTHINDEISEILEEEQKKAQLIYPHYFEKYRTDGVEYNIYIGQSLVRDIPYSDVYLSNIRLWQFILKVKIARRIREIQPVLKTKLDVTQLILIHSSALSIAFRQDEKKFDVDGAYNIRYEITKKRIDKATIKGTQERLTQVGKIAVVYANSNEITEYKRNIDFMISEGYLKNNVENLELEDLIGASGLKALRVEVNYQ